MTTVFTDPLFKKTTLITTDGKNSITISLRDSSNRYLQDLLRNDSKGACVGRMIDPALLPNWMVPGTILIGYVGSLKIILTVEAVIQSRVESVEELLGSKVRFTYVTTSEFK